MTNEQRDRHVDKQTTDKHPARQTDQQPNTKREKERKEEKKGSKGNAENFAVL